MVTQNGRHIGQHLAQAQLGQGHAVVLVHKGLDLGLQLADLHSWLVTRPVQQHIGHGLGLVLHQAQQQLQQLITTALRQPANHPEVDECDAVARQVKHIARMGVCVEDAVFHNHLEHGVGAALGEQRAFKTRLGRESFQMVARNPVDEVLHVHSFARVSPVHLGDGDEAQGRHVGGNALGMAAFAGQVQLTLERTGKFAHQLLGAVGLECGQLGLCQCRQAQQQAQVGLDRVGNTGAANLDDDFSAVVQTRPVDLRDGGCGQRRGVKPCEHSLGLVAQVFTQLRAQCVNRQGGYVAVQLLELGNPLRAKQVGPAREDLAKLHERGPQFLQRQPHLHGGLQPRQFSGVGPVQHLPGALQPVCQAQAAHGVAKAVAHHHAQNFLEAAQVSCGVQSLDQHQPMIVRKGRGRGPRHGPGIYPPRVGLFTIRKNTTAMATNAG